MRTEITNGSRVLYHRKGRKYIGTVVSESCGGFVVEFDNPHVFCSYGGSDHHSVCNESELTLSSENNSVVNGKDKIFMGNETMFNGMFGKIASGMCRLSMSGGIAVKTSGGYKSFNVKTGALTNCSNFVFNSGDEFFFVIPTNKVIKGDIILVNGKPKCVIEAEKNKITVINYEDSTMETIVPERHVFMGNTYFYGKIVSMFGNNFTKGKNGMNKIMSYMMMSEMMKGANSGASNGISAMLPFMMMNNSGNMFEDMFGFDSDDSDETTDSCDETESVESEG